jgi:hypothetical protein
MRDEKQSSSPCLSEGEGSLHVLENPEVAAYVEVELCHGWRAI